MTRPSSRLQDIQIGIRSVCPADAERGQVGGIEGLIFGVLIFIFGTLTVTNAWGVVDAKFAAGAAAREAARTYVEASDAEAASTGARQAAEEAIIGHGRAVDRMTLARIEGEFARCSRVTMEVRYAVPFIHVPLIGGLGSGFTVSSRHSELVDPYRSGVGRKAADCAAA